jgi:hypothetical protein
VPRVTKHEGSAVPTDLTGEGQLAQDFLSQVGANVRALRKQRALTVQQLADRSQISRRHLQEVTAESRSADRWLWRLVPADTYRGQADPARGAMGLRLSIPRSPRSREKVLVCRGLIAPALG